MTSARIVLDSISPLAVRLTTFEVRFHRFILPEFNTHRVFCLAGDSELEFELPSGRTKDGGPRVHRLTIEQFVDRWHNGADRKISNPKRPLDTSWIDNQEWYEVPVLAEKLGFNKSAIHNACRWGKIDSRKNGRTWQVKGGSFIEWRNSKPEHTKFGIQKRLASMRIRQVNELTGKIQTSTVKNCCFSGVKEVFRVKAGEWSVAGSVDHRILTTTGYVRIGDLTPGKSQVIVSRFGKIESDKLDPTRLQKIDGIWRSGWQHKYKASVPQICNTCNATQGSFEVHHIVPVHMDSSVALDENNVVLLCPSCHAGEHRIQGWQGGTYLYGAPITVDSIVSEGKKETYDLEIAGEFPNFLANGIVVHNSKNGASSRAIPLRRKDRRGTLDRVLDDPAWPAEWLSELPGMQPGPPLTGEDADEAERLFRRCHGLITTAVEAYLDDHPEPETRLHKSILNRLLEPFMWQVMVVTTTEIENFLNQRAGLRTQMPQLEFALLADAMLQCYEASTPTELDYGQWHLPYVQDDEADCDVAEQRQMSAARCARTSLENQNGVRSVEDDFKLFDRLVTATPKHLSPLEHQATPATRGEIEENNVSGNFYGWHQFRHEIFPHTWDHGLNGNQDSVQ